MRARQARFIRYFFAILFCLGLDHAAAIAQTAGPTDRPILQIDAGMHTAIIRRIGSDAACSFLATASEDKTIRLWRLPDGKLLNTLRPPLGDDSDGRVYATAVSPDGGWIAAGGLTRRPGYHLIYVFQSATGNIMKALGPFPQVIRHLSVSADGQYLAATFRGGVGVRVWKRGSSGIDDWTLVLQDARYSDRDADGAAFDRDNRLYTVADDGKLRRYSFSPAVSMEMIQTASGAPHSVAVQPGGKLVAIGSGDSQKVDVYETSPLRHSYQASATGNATGDLSAVSWSSDGRFLFAGGTFVSDNRNVILKWSEQGKGPPQAIGAARDVITQIIPCGEKIAFSAGDPSFGLINAEGTRTLSKEGAGPDMRGKLGNNFTISPDGLKVRFGLGGGGQDPVIFELPNGTLRDSPASVDNLFAADTESLPVTSWNFSRNPALDGATLPLTPNEKALSVAIAPDRSLFALGADYYLRLFAKDGSQVWMKPAPGAVWGINIAKERNLLVAACGDGTLRWYRLDNGNLLLSVFVQRTDRRWIAWTPAGYFTTSVGGETLIGWSVNRSWSDAADFSAAAKFRDLFYRPDIVNRVLADLSEGDAIEQSNQIRKRLPPVVQLLDPADGSAITGETAKLKYSVRSPSGMPVKLSVLVNGAKTDQIDIAIENSSEASIKTLDIKMPERDASVSLVAETEQSSGDRVGLTLRRSAGSPVAPEVKPNLYAVLVGVGSYDNASMVLDFPANDVDRFEEELKKQDGKAFGKVTIHKLTNRIAGQEASAGNIVKELVWLKDKVQAPEDLALFYFSGHGKKVTGGSSYLLPVDFSGDPDISALSKPRIFDILKKVGGGLILFVDACFASDGLDTVDFLNDTASWQTLPVISFASSSRGQRSYGRGKNSFYTAALADAFDGKAPHDKNVLRTDELSVFLTRKVRELASPDVQEPDMTKSPAWRHIPIAVVQ